MDYHLTERDYLLSPHKQTIVNQLLYATTISQFTRKELVCSNYELILVPYPINICFVKTTIQQ